MKVTLCSNTHDKEQACKESSKELQINNGFTEIHIKV